MCIIIRRICSCTFTLFTNTPFVELLSMTFQTMSPCALHFTETKFAWTREIILGSNKLSTKTTSHVFFLPTVISGFVSLINAGRVFDCLGSISDNVASTATLIANFSSLATKQKCKPNQSKWSCLTAGLRQSAANCLFFLHISNIF